MSERGCCLVIGANGFVGSHLVDELAEAGFVVRAFDRFSRTPVFAQAKKIKVIAGDIFDDIAVLNALDGADYVLHCFSATTPIASDADPYSDITLNLLRSVQIFEMCVEKKIKKVGFISSGGAVYGRVSEHKFVDENDVPLPISPYGVGKLSIEYYLSYFKQKYGLEHVIYRLTNPYGPRQASNSNQGVIPIFINKIKAGGELQVYGDGSSSRDYIYVRDAAKMIATSFATHVRHSLYNIGSGHQTSLSEIISTAEKVTNLKAKVVYRDLPKTFLQKSEVSIARYVDEFGSIPSTSLEDGIRQTIEYS